MTRRNFVCGLALPVLGHAITPQTTTTERELFVLVNEERAKRGLPGLQWSDKVAAVARAHSQRMADQQFFAHVDPDLGDLRNRLALQKVEWMRCAENLYREHGYPSVIEPAIQGWLQSPGHQANLLGPDYTYSGLGIAVSRTDTYYVTQVFVKHADADFEAEWGRKKR